MTTRKSMDRSSRPATRVPNVAENFQLPRLSAVTSGPLPVALEGHQPLSPSPGFPALVWTPPALPPRARRSGVACWMYPQEGLSILFQWLVSLGKVSLHSTLDGRRAVHGGRFAPVPRPCVIESFRERDSTFCKGFTGTY